MNFGKVVKVIVSAAAALAALAEVVSTYKEKSDS